MLPLQTAKIRGFIPIGRSDLAQHVPPFPFPGFRSLFLRAARVVDDRRLDVPMPLRTLIAGKLEKSGVLPLQTAKIRGFISVGRSDLASMYDESLPPGLLLGTDHDNADG